MNIRSTLSAVALAGLLTQPAQAITLFYGAAPGASNSTVIADLDSFAPGFQTLSVSVPTEFTLAVLSFPVVSEVFGSVVNLPTLSFTSLTIFSAEHTYGYTLPTPAATLFFKDVLAPGDYTVSFGYTTPGPLSLYAGFADATPAVPEGSTLWMSMVGVGLAGYGVWRQRRQAADARLASPMGVPQAA